MCAVSSVAGMLYVLLICFGLVHKLEHTLSVITVCWTCYAVLYVCLIVLSISMITYKIDFSLDRNGLSCKLCIPSDPLNRIFIYTLSSNRSYVEKIINNLKCSFVYTQIHFTEYLYIYVCTLSARTGHKLRK